MKPLFLAITMALPFLCFSQYTYDHVKVDFSTAGIYTYKNLRLYPVRAKESFKNQFRSVGTYLTLQEAIAKNKIKIAEKDESGTVEELSMENISNDTIIILPGEIIKGGKQDRIIRKDVVLAPHSGKKRLEVFCVESGRWSDREPVRKTSSAADFKSYHSKGAVSLRKVVEKESDQSKVWNEVENINKKNKTATRTKTYTAITNSDNLNKEMAQYIKFFLGKLKAENDVIGVVVVTGGRVVGCDLFATHELFAGQLESLLQSYATEAILNGNVAVINTQTVKAYADKLFKSESVQQATLKAKGSSFTHNGKKLRVSNFD
ncbi:MAG: hypothetical protein JNK79_02705 [Chitinophagaceae bacterium]|nr:hypothetical protein [Chitinophagaceae bacterium]